MKKKEMHGIERLKVRYGRMFLLPWFIGVLLFFLVPLVSSVIYAFSEVTLVNGVHTKFVFLDQFKYLFNEDPNYVNNLGKAIASFLYSLPIVVALSLIFAVILNQKFYGRIFARAVFFLPVIVASGVVMQYVLTGSALGEDRVLSTALGGSNGNTAMEFSEVLGRLGLPDKITEVLNDYITNVFNLVWSCGIQILLFVAGMQAIPEQLYEVSKIEGATAWEEFWFVTFPMLGNVIFLVLIYTMVDLFTAYNNPVMQQTYEMIGKNSNYGGSSAAIWGYFLIVGVIGGLILLIYNRIFMRRWN